MTIPCLQFQYGFVHCRTRQEPEKYADFPTGAKVSVCRKTSNPHWPEGKYIYSLRVNDKNEWIEMTGAELEGLYLCLNQDDCHVKKVELV
jgi:hypothetical protein